MNKKLSAKIQRINPATPDTSRSFSETLTIIPEDKDVILKKGSVYCVFNISGTLDFDTKLIIKVVNDILHDSYYQSDNISPIQSMEKAISDVRDGVTKISIDTAKMHEAKVEFNITSSVLWGNVVYLVQYGKGSTYLIRDNEIKPINVITEGSFSSASGVIKDGDVVALCTDEFSKIYTPEKLLVTSISEKELPPSAGCLILKFIVDTTFSENEVIEFADTSASAAPKKRAKLAKFSSIKLKSFKGPKVKISSKHLIPALLIIFVLSIFFTIKNKQKLIIKNLAPVIQETTQSTTSADVQTAENEKFKITRTSVEPFYDIKITDPNATPSDIAVLDNNVVVTDKSTGKVYISGISTPKFTVDTNIFTGINSLNYDGGKLSFSDTQGYKVYDVVGGKVAETYTVSNMSLTSTYLGFIYSLSGDKITKYVKDGKVLADNLWGQNPELIDARSMSVAVNIYVIRADGTLIRLTRGAKDDFAVTGLDKPLSGPRKVLAHSNFTNIYIADSNNDRVVVINDKGELVKQIKHTKAVAWDDIRSIGVSPKEDKLFVLSGSTVYEVAL